MKKIIRGILLLAGIAGLVTAVYFGILSYRAGYLNLSFFHTLPEYNPSSANATSEYYLAWGFRIEFWLLLLMSLFAVICLYRENKRKFKEISVARMETVRKNNPNMIPATEAALKAGEIITELKAMQKEKDGQLCYYGMGTVRKGLRKLKKAVAMAPVDPEIVSQLNGIGYLLNLSQQRVFTFFSCFGGGIVPSDDFKDVERIRRKNAWAFWGLFILFAVVVILVVAMMRALGLDVEIIAARVLYFLMVAVAILIPGYLLFLTPGYRYRSIAKGFLELRSTTKVSLNDASKSFNAAMADMINNPPEYIEVRDRGGDRVEEVKVKDYAGALFGAGIGIAVIIVLFILAIYAMLFVGIPLLLLYIFFRNYIIMR